MHEKLTVDDEDLSFSRGNVGDVEEVNVVLSKGHDGLVAGAEGGLLDIGPGERGRVGRRLCLHVEEEEIRPRDGIEDVGVVVEDGIEVRRVELARGDRLSAPGLRGCVENVHR